MSTTNSPFVARDHYVSNSVTTPLNHAGSNANSSINNPQVKIMHDWLDACAGQSIQIWCGDPIVNTEKFAGGVLGGRTYFTYCIYYKQYGRDMTLVRHRYSEFETIRSEIRDRYHTYGLLVPSLPPKQALLSVAVSNLLSNDDDTFVKERTLGLTLFCENMINNPWLRNDNTWKAFLRPTSSPDNMTFLSASPHENLGESQLKNCLELLSLPSKSLVLEKMDYLRAEVNAIEKNARNLLEKVRVMQKCERALQTAQDQLRDSLESFTNTEKQIKFLGGRSFHDIPSQVLLPQDMVSNSSNALFKMVQAKCEAEHDLTGYTGLTLVVALEQELSLAESLKELIKVYDDFNTIIETLNNKLRTVTKVEQVLELKRQLEEKEKSLETFCTGLVYFSLPLAARQRAANARRFFAGYTATTTSASFITYKACSEFFQSLLMSSHIANEEISKWFTSSGQRPLAKLPTLDHGMQDLETSLPVSPYPSKAETQIDAEKGSPVNFLPATPKSVSINSNAFFPKTPQKNSSFQELNALPTSHDHDQSEPNEGNFNRNNSVSGNNTIRGLNVSPGFHGMSGLFSRALMLSRGIQPSPSPIAISSMAAASNAINQNSNSGSTTANSTSSAGTAIGVAGLQMSNGGDNSSSSTNPTSNGNNNNPLAMRRGSAILGLRKQQSEDSEALAIATASLNSAGNLQRTSSSSNVDDSSTPMSTGGSSSTKNPLARRSSAVLNNRKVEENTPREAMTSFPFDEEICYPENMDNK